MKDVQETARGQSDIGFQVLMFPVSKLSLSQRAYGKERQGFKSKWISYSI